jgi:hypothetical protein
MKTVAKRGHTPPSSATTACHANEVRFIYAADYERGLPTTRQALLRERPPLSLRRIVGPVLHLILPERTLHLVEQRPQEVAGERSLAGLE